MLYLAIMTDCFHAFLMAAWVIGMPLLFWHRYLKISLAYCCFCLAFIIVNQVSHYTLGECIFTTIARFFYTKAGQYPNGEWFTVRIAQTIFGLTPSHRGIKILTESLVGVAAIGGIYSLYQEFKSRSLSRQGL